MDLLPSTEDVPFALTVTSDTIELKVGGQRIGVAELTGVPTGIALYNMGDVRHSVRISALRLEPAAE